MEALEEKIKTLEMEGKVVNKQFNDVDSFYISQKEFSEAIATTPEPHIKSTPEAPLTLAAPNQRTGNRSNGIEIVLLGTVFHKPKRQYKWWVLAGYTIR